jgi:peptide chain release factor 3
MEIEKQRGISITTSVMQFVFKDCLFNLLDTPGHADFSEDTYRTLSAVDAALMVIDAVKGVEERTKKLMDICRMRDIPIITFINKLDRGAMNPLELLDNIETSLNIKTQPITWPVGIGKDFKGVYHFFKKCCYLYESGRNFLIQSPKEESLDIAANMLSEYERNELLDEISLVEQESIDRESYLKGETTPVYFGSALNNFGIQELLNGFVEYAPGPLSRKTEKGDVIEPTDSQFRAFVFKIQANMDPQHRDRVAFCRVCSGSYERGQKLYHVESDKFFMHTQAVTFLGQERSHIEKAVAGDIIGLINHGQIHIGDTFCDKKTSQLKFKGIPRFSPELFKSIRSSDPLKSKQLNHALTQLSQEGAVQFFRKKIGQELILGAIGALQFDVVAARLQNEYQLSCLYQPCSYVIACWIECTDSTKLEQFLDHHADQVALDSYQAWVFLASSHVQKRLVQERFPWIELKNLQEC